MSSNGNVKNIIVLGWIWMFIALMFNTSTELLINTIRGHGTEWAQEHLGIEGVIFGLVLMPIYALVSVLTGILSARWFKYAVVALTLAAALFTVVHHVHDVMEGERPWFSYVPLVMHHVLAAFVLVAAVKWLRQPAE